MNKIGLIAPITSWGSGKKYGYAHVRTKEIRNIYRILNLLAANNDERLEEEGRAGAPSTLQHGPSGVDLSIPHPEGTLTKDREGSTWLMRKGRWEMFVNAESTKTTRILPTGQELEDKASQNPPLRPTCPLFFARAQVVTVDAICKWLGDQGVDFSRQLRAEAQRVLQEAHRCP